MAGTLIAYHTPRLTTRLPNAAEIAGCSGAGLDTSAWTEENYEAAAGKIFSQRSVDRHRAEFAFTAASPVDVPGLIQVFAFGEPTMRLSHCSEDGDVRTATGSNILIQDDRSIDAMITVGKYGTGLCIEMIPTDQDTRILLPIPPQSGATDKVAKRWQTFPRVSVRGDYLGADYRPISGRLNISIDNLTRDFIEETWEPFREHCSKGGIFVYSSAAAAAAADASDNFSFYFAVATEFAYCYAEGNVPAPVIRAGGYGSVSLNAGVARIP